MKAMLRQAAAPGQRGDGEVQPGRSQRHEDREHRSEREGDRPEPRRLDAPHLGDEELDDPAPGVANVRDDSECDDADHGEERRIRKPDRQSTELFARPRSCDDDRGAYQASYADDEVVVEAAGFPPPDGAKNPPD